mmetsp:Transcript_27305/g.45478  ORF Transcript_27305/g.45478 Transcript_27305/m.45478 type:complete len:350 (-) Transcript_27305:84-1133(-)
MGETTTATPAAANVEGNANNKQVEQPKPTDHNPRFKGYIYIIFTSLVSFGSTSNIGTDEKYWGISVSIGVVTFTISLIIVALDRFQNCFESFKFHKAMDGKLEGFTLLFFFFWWIMGVYIMTRAGGIAYNATNIYVSGWLALFACGYNLNEWSGSKDIVTARELTAISTTLRGWYCLFFSSIVVLGSSAHLHSALDPSSGHAQEASFGVALGVLSFIVAGIYILAHYRFMPSIKVGGWMELIVTFFMILFWTVGVAILTQDGGVAASINGVCHVVVIDESTTLSIVPGSNIYVFSWFCLVSALDIALRWKAAQAMAFAHASQATKASSGAQEDENENDDMDDDDYDEEI